jgi:hypothetical protein
MSNGPATSREVRPTVVTANRCDTTASTPNLEAVRDTSFDATVSGLLPALALPPAERARLRDSYAAMKPYPHLVHDGLFPDWVLDRVVEEFPAPGTRDWIKWDTNHELKQTSRGLTGLSPFTQLFLLELCSEPFLRFMRELTGYDDLVADPLFHGGGLHESFLGSYLNIHADYTHHPVLPLVRRVNLIIYLNRDWPEEWGGHIELWDAKKKTREVSVAPVFNRSLVFPTTQTALHGFPTPITCPDNRSRKSISIFYWTANPDAVKQGAHINFMPGLKSTKAKALLRSCVPPIVYRELHHARTFVRHRIRDLKKRQPSPPRK